MCMDQGIRRRLIIALWVLLRSLTWMSLLHVDFVAECSLQVVSTPGNVTIGGLFPLFIPDQEGRCSVVNSALGIPQLEAFLFSIDQINANTTFLPNITLGVKAFDTCDSKTAALDRAVKGFVLGEDELKRQMYMQHTHSVIGVIGPGYSYEAIHVSPFLGLFDIPLVSYGATSPELSDKSKYKYFSRTLPQDSLQGKVILELLKTFNWTYVSVVYSDEPYGRSGYDFLKTKAPHYGICFADSHKLPQTYSLRKYQKVVRKIISNEDARTVVIFCMESVILPFMKEVQRQMLPRHRLQFIGSETLGMLRDWTEVRDITSGVDITSKPVLEFNEYFLDLSVDKNVRNPWFREFFQTNANCSFDEAQSTNRLCNSTQSLRDIKYAVSLEVFNTISFVVDSVYAFAHALHSTRERSRGRERHNLWHVPGNEILKRLRTSSFKSFTGRTVEISESGDVLGGYGIYYMDEVQQGIFENTKIGEWQPGGDSGNALRMLTEDFGRWKFMDVQSHCSETCQPGEVRQGVVGKPSCCSKCTPCPVEAFVVNETTCQTCQTGYRPDRTRRTCAPLEIKYFTIDGYLVSFSLICPPLIVSAVSIPAIFFTVVVFVRYNSTPLVKASAREFSYLHLLGLFLSYLYPFVAVIKPSHFTCFLQLVLDSLPLAICLVAIALKNNRTFRIFNPKRRKLPSLAKPRHQLALALLLITIQVLLLILIIVFEFPHAKLVYPTTRDEIQLVCIISDKQRYLSHAYNALLLIACTYYAYRTRHIPRNFNEAKCAAFAMYGACVMFLAFFVVSMAANQGGEDSNHWNGPIIICYRNTFTASFLSVCFFAPKLYIILCKAEDNIKGRSSATVVPGELFSKRMAHGLTLPASQTKITEVINQSTQTE